MFPPSAPVPLPPCHDADVVGQDTDVFKVATSLVKVTLPEDDKLSDVIKEAAELDAAAENAAADKAAEQAAAEAVAEKAPAEQAAAEKAAAEQTAAAKATADKAAAE